MWTARILSCFWISLLTGCAFGPLVRVDHDFEPVGSLPVPRSVITQPRGFEVSRQPLGKPRKVLARPSAQAGVHLRLSLDQQLDKLSYVKHVPGPTVGSTAWQELLALGNATEDWARNELAEMLRRKDPGADADPPSVSKQVVEPDPSRPARMGAQGLLIAGAGARLPEVSLDFGQDDMRQVRKVSSGSQTFIMVLVDLASGRLVWVGVDRMMTGGTREHWPEPTQALTSEQALRRLFERFPDLPRPEPKLPEPAAQADAAEGAAARER